MAALGYKNTRAKSNAVCNENGLLEGKDWLGITLISPAADSVCCCGTQAKIMGSMRSKVP